MIAASLRGEATMAATASADDRDLAEAFLARRPEALEAVYRRYGAMLYAVARSVLGNGADAEDCVHDALVRLWERPNSFRPERGSLRAFLSVCVRNEAITRKRNAARHFGIEQNVAAQETLGEAATFEDTDYVELARLRRALASLPEEQRDVIALAYYGHRSQTEIAAELGVPLGTVKSRVSLAMRKLERALRQGEG
jgi:RNA polymerase sigma-70 factor (ECF subfamily)